MRSTIDELVSELAELSALVASIAPVNSVLADHQDSLVRKYVTIRRRFDYAAFVVALYASFEKFIENLVAAYARLASLRVQYADLPPKLVKKHLLRTADILARGRVGEGRYTGLSEVDIVKNLLDCLNGTTPYTLNEAAIVAHDRNLRINDIDELFAAVGIDTVCDRVRRADALLKWYRTSDGRADTVPDGTVKRRLDEFVERRNQVAHRGGTPANLLGVDEMSEVLGFIEAFSKSVFGIVVGQYLKGQHAASGIDLTQRPGDGPYKGGTVVVVEKPAQRLFVGQPLFVVVESTGARWGRIKSMKIDDTNVRSVEPDTDAPNGIGIALKFKCPKGAPLIALADEDDVVWSP